MTPERQLDSFIAQYSPAIARQGRAALAKLRQLARGATLLVYDNYNALAIAFGASERMADVVCSIALYPRWISLFFAHGRTLPDPAKILRGSGKHIRHVRLDDGARTLDRPAVRELLAAAITRSRLDPKTKTRIVIRSISAKRRPRRPRSV